MQLKKLILTFVIALSSILTLTAQGQIRDWTGETYEQD